MRRWVSTCSTVTPVNKVPGTAARWWPTMLVPLALFFSTSRCCDAMRSWRSPDVRQIPAAFPRSTRYYFVKANDAARPSRPSRNSRAALIDDRSIPPAISIRTLPPPSIICMYTIDSCPCCLSKELTARWAVVAPFLAHYAVGSRHFSAGSWGVLGLFIPVLRFASRAAEVERLYSGYRGERYFDRASSCSRQSSAASMAQQDTWNSATESCASYLVRLSFRLDHHGAPNLAKQTTARSRQTIRRRRHHPSARVVPPARHRRLRRRARHSPARSAAGPRRSACGCGTKFCAAGWRPPPYPVGAPANSSCSFPWVNWLRGRCLQEVNPLDSMDRLES